MREGSVSLSVLQRIARAEDGVGEIRWKKESRSANIVGVTVGQMPMVAKFPGHAIFQALPSEEREAQVRLFNRITNVFRERLMRHHVPLSRTYLVGMQDDGLPVHLTNDEGDDCAAIVMKSPEKIHGILEGVLASIRGVLANGRRRIGLDARLSNFSVARDGGVLYIDIFPPLLFYGRRYFVHFPNPSRRREVRNEVARKFTPFGILRRLRFDLMGVDPAWDRVFYNALKRVLPSMWQGLGEQFAALADHVITQMPRRKQLAFLESLAPSDVDTRREIAARVIPMGREREELLKRMFAATSYVGATEEERATRLGDFRRLMEQLL